MPLDFRSAAALFLGREDELVRALGIEQRELRRYRDRPGETPPAVLARLANTLTERGRAMVRVAEMLREDTTGSDANGGGGPGGGDGGGDGGGLVV